MKLTIESWGSWWRKAARPLPHRLLMCFCVLLVFLVLFIFV